MAAQDRPTYQIDSIMGYLYSMIEPFNFKKGVT
jgi:hypothetical protein